MCKTKKQTFEEKETTWERERCNAKMQHRQNLTTSPISLPSPAHPVNPQIPATHPEAIPITDRTLSMLCALYRNVVTSKTSFSFSDTAAAGASKFAIGSIMIGRAVKEKATLKLAPKLSIEIESFRAVEAADVYGNQKVRVTKHCANQGSTIIHHNVTTAPTAPSSSQTLEPLVGRTKRRMDFGVKMIVETTQKGRIQMKVTEASCCWNQTVVAKITEAAKKHNIFAEIECIVTETQWVVNCNN